MVKSSASLLRRAFGSRFRVLTTLLVIGYTLLIGATLLLVIADRRVTHYRVSAVTEAFSARLARELRIGRTGVQIAGQPACRRAALALPEGTELKGARYSATGTTYIDVVGRPEAPLEATCESGQVLKVGSLTLSGRAVKDDGATAKDDARAVLRIGGRITVGGQVDESTPPENVELLRSARIVSEIKEWPGGSMTVLSEREVDGGSRLNFRRTDDGEEAVAEGVVLVRPNTFELVLRFTGHSVVVTAPGAERGVAVVVAPSFFDRLKGHAVWGVLVVMASLLLGLVEALRSYEVAPASARGRRDDAPGKAKRDD